MSTARQSAERACELSAILARHCDLSPAVIARHVCHLQRMARQAKNAATALCNVPDYQEIHDRRIDGLQKRADSVLGALGVSGARTVLGGDPRGPCFWLTLPGIRGDGWENDNRLAVY